MPPCAAALFSSVLRGSSFSDSGEAMMPGQLDNFLCALAFAGGE